MLLAGLGGDLDDLGEFLVDLGLELVEGLHLDMTSMYVCVVALFEAVALEFGLAQTLGQLVYMLLVQAILLLQGLYVLFLALTGLLGALPVPFQLLVPTQGRLALLELRKIHIIILRLDIVLLIHQLSHLVPVEHFLLVFGLGLGFVGLVHSVILFDVRVNAFALHEVHAEVLWVAVLLLDHEMGEEGVAVWSVVVQEVQTGLLFEAKWVRHTLYYMIGWDIFGQNLIYNFRIRVICLFIRFVFYISNLVFRKDVGS